MPVTAIACPAGHSGETLHNKSLEVNSLKMQWQPLPPVGQGAAVYREWRGGTRTLNLLKRKKKGSESLGRSARQF